MLDKLPVQNFCREPPLDRETFTSRPKKEGKMCMQDNVCNNFLYYLYYTVSHHLSYVCGLVLVASSWWPRLGGLVLVASSWWPRLGGLVLVASSWWPRLGGLVLVASSWWPRLGGLVLVASSWWPRLGGLVLVASSWWPRLGGLVLVASSWWPRLGGLVCQVEWVHPHPQLAKKPPKFLVYLLTIVAIHGEEPTSQLG